MEVRLMTSKMGLCSFTGSSLEKAQISDYSLIVK